jgi:hypothetical protein
MLHNQLLGCKDRYLMDIESVNARSEAHLLLLQQDVQKCQIIKKKINKMQQEVFLQIKLYNKFFNWF